MDETATQGAPVAHLHVADLRSEFGQERAFVAEQRGSFNVVVGRHRADGYVAAGRANVIEIGDAADVDNGLRLCQAQFHRRHQAVPAGQDFGVRAMQFQERNRFLECCGAQIVERGGNHGSEVAGLWYCPAVCATGRFVFM